MENDTIAAIATGNANAGISIIRVSGKDAIKIADKLTPNLDLVSCNAREMYLTLIDGGNVKDRALVVKFIAPKTFTGEDVVEFHLHGGQVLTTLMLKQIIKAGARLAAPGEFSKRAFMNGKMSLDGVEGTIDVINAQSEAEVTAGYNLYIGALKEKTEKLQSVLTDLLAEIEVSLDYPEEDIEYSTQNKILKATNDINAELEALIASFETGKVIKEGINVAIVGKPNVGKSSLLNAMLNYNRAIVTSIEGTTRDTLEETYSYKGVNVNLIDTAGIRESDNQIERIGIERSKASVNEANIILLVVDGSQKLSSQDREVFELVKNVQKPLIIAINKSDIESENQLSTKKEIESEFAGRKIFVISAQNDNGVSDIKEEIYNVVYGSQMSSNQLIITNLRHLEALSKANESIILAKNAISSVGLDCVALDLKAAWSALSQITGKEITEEVLDTIFSKFCLGK